MLSPATKADDRGVKLRAYRRLPSVRHILLLASDQPAAEHYARSGARWLLSDLGPGAAVRLDGLEAAFALDGIHDGLALDAAEDETAPRQGWRAQPAGTARAPARFKGTPWTLKAASPSPPARRRRCGGRWR